LGGIDFSQGRLLQLSAFATPLDKIPRARHPAGDGI
jgi:hypothetical protein